MPKPLFTSKTTAVYTRLRQRIIDGRLAPGARLVIAQVAAEFGVSPIPAREAILRLVADGFADFTPNIGARVAAISPEHIDEVFALLEALEVTSGRALCASITPAQTAELRALVEGLERLVRRQAAWSERNAQFHRRICRLAGYHLTEALFERVQVNWDRLRRTFLKDVFLAHLAQAQQEHRLMLDALEKHDADRYEAIIRRHNQRARAAYRSALARLTQA